MPPWIKSAAWLGFGGRGGTDTGEEYQLAGCEEGLYPQGDVSQFSSCSPASGLVVTLARPDAGLLQGTPGIQGGHEPGNQEAWVPVSILPPGPWDPG